MIVREMKSFSIQNLHKAFLRFKELASSYNQGARFRFATATACVRVAMVPLGTQCGGGLSLWCGL